MPPQRIQDDSELVGRCLNGDAAAWGALVDRHTPLVYSVLVRCGLPADLCDDVYQVVLLSLLRNLAAVRDHRSLAKWLIVTARREGARAQAARRREGAMLDGLVGDPGGAEPPLAELERLERNQRVWAAMDRLEPRCRDLLMALFACGDRPDYHAVAAKLGIPVGSIGPSRARCLARLLDMLGDDRPRAV